MPFPSRKTCHRDMVESIIGRFVDKFVGKPLCHRRNPALHMPPKPRKNLSRLTWHLCAFLNGSRTSLIVQLGKSKEEMPQKFLREDRETEKRKRSHQNPAVFLLVEDIYWVNYCAHRLSSLGSALSCCRHQQEHTALSGLPCSLHSTREAKTQTTRQRQRARGRFTMPRKYVACPTPHFSAPSSPEKPMKKDIHPNYREVVFQDASAEFSFLTRSTVPSEHTITWEDGNEYPLVKVELSSESHPFYTGKMKLVDTAGRIEKFRRKYQRLSPPMSETKNESDS